MEQYPQQHLISSEKKKQQHQFYWYPMQNLSVIFFTLSFRCQLSYHLFKFRHKLDSIKYVFPLRSQHSILQHKLRRWSKPIQQGSIKISCFFHSLYFLVRQCNYRLTNLEWHEEVCLLFHDESAIGNRRGFIIKDASPFQCWPVSI